MYGKKYHLFDEEVKATEEEEEAKAYRPAPSIEGFLAIFGAVIAAAWVMSYLPKKDKSHGANRVLKLVI